MSMEKVRSLEEIATVIKTRLRYLPSLQTLKAVIDLIINKSTNSINIQCLSVT